MDKEDSARREDRRGETIRRRTDSKEIMDLLRIVKQLVALALCHNPPAQSS